MKKISIQFAILAVLCLGQLGSQADTTQANHIADKRKTNNNWGSCPALIQGRKLNQYNLEKAITEQPFPGAIYLEADQGIVRQQGVSELLGNIIIQQNQTVFNADSARINRDTSEVDATGHVSFFTPNFKLNSSRVQYNLEQHTGEIKQARYQLGNEGAHGNSARIKQIDKNNLRLYGASFTTCPAPVNSWYLSSSEIKLNNESQIGNARNVKLNVGKIPVFYFPWFRFPLNNQRLSGFLTPSVRLQSGTGISIPYYLNLAPNYDATLTVSNFSDRGIQLNSEFRYLSPTHKGIMAYEIIPSDRSFNNEKRDYFNIMHHTELNNNTHINVKAEGVSDKNYFDSKGESLETSSISSLERRIEITNKRGPWHSSAAVEDYQVLDTSEAPYSKLPELKLRYAPDIFPRKLNLSVEAESTYFDRDKSTTGTRIDVGLHASKKWGNEAWFIKPSMGLRYTAYSLNNHPDGNSQNRSLPTFTLDSGLFFERETGAGKYMQTLEPRLFYTYTPFKDQSKLPIFDTALTDFSTTSQLFAENRFTGKDRIGDSNQLTFAISTYLQDKNNGKEILKASIGQIFNFDDRKVTLPGGTIQTARRSELVLELGGRLSDNFRASAISLYNPEQNRPSRTELRVNYHDQHKRIGNLSYRELDSELQQLSGSFFMPVSNKWSLVGSFDHDLKKDRNLETLAGVEYQDCCWKTRVVMKRYLTADNRTYDNPIFIEFELKGLGNLGSGASRQLEEKIYGYDD